MSKQSGIDSDTDADGDTDKIVSQNQRVLLANNSAKAKGINTGLTISTARALSQNLIIFERDIAREQRQLQAIAESLYCYSPDIICHSNNRKQHSLILEIGRSLKLFNGAEVLQKSIDDQLQQYFPSPTRNCNLAGSTLDASKTPLEIDSAENNSARQTTLSRQFALSSTVKSAELLARYYCLQKPIPPQQAKTQEGNLKAVLSDIPITLLDSKEKTLQHCQNMGIDSLGKLIQLPKASLKKRFDNDFIDHIDKLLGDKVDLHRFIQLPRIFAQEQYHIDGLHNHANLMPSIKQLLQQLCTFLQMRQLQVSALQWRFVRFSKKSNTLDVAFSEPQHHHSVLLSLTELKLEQIPLDSPVECVQLSAKQFIPWINNDSDFFTPQSKPAHSFAVLADTLSSKLGSTALAQVHSTEQHIPEMANQLRFFNSSTSHSSTINFSTLNSPNTKLKKTPPHEQASLRPDWLLAKPEPLKQKGLYLYRKHQSISLLSGPERIEGSWWQEEVSRDYYIAVEKITAGKSMVQKETNNTQAATCQQFYWIFQNRKNRQWYLHGVFA